MVETSIQDVRNNSISYAVDKERVIVSGSSTPVSNGDKRSSQQAEPFELRHGQPTSPQLNTPTRELERQSEMSAPDKILAGEENAEQSEILGE